MGKIAELADEHTLSVYDATYLELALRRGLPLASLDTALNKAARMSGVETLVLGNTSPFGSVVRQHYRPF